MPPKPDTLSILQGPPLWTYSEHFRIFHVNDFPTEAAGIDPMVACLMDNVAVAYVPIIGWHCQCFALKTANIQFLVLVDALFAKSGELQLNDCLRSTVSVTVPMRPVWTYVTRVWTELNLVCSIKWRSMDQQKVLLLFVTSAMLYHMIHISLCNIPWPSSLF